MSKISWVALWASFVGVTLFLPAIYYWDIYNDGYSAGFVEGEDHNARMHEVSRREQQEFLESADEMCLSACSLNGFPSLNAFYVSNRARCVCQDVGATDDTHGFFLLPIPEIER